MSPKAFPPSGRLIRFLSQDRKKGDERIVPMESLLPPTLTTCSRLRPTFTLALPYLSIPVAFRGVLFTPRLSTRQASASGQLSLSQERACCLKPSLPGPLPLLLSSLSSAGLSPCSQKHGMASSGSNHSWVVPASPHSSSPGLQSLPTVQATALIHVLGLT